VRDVRLDLLLIGFGHVGRRFVRLLAERRADLVREFDLDARVVGIATRRHGAALATTGIDAVGAADLVEGGQSLSVLHDARLGPPPATGVELIAVAANAGLATGRSVMVETTPLDIVDGQPATDHIRAAMRSGMHVVSANKGPVAFAHRELAVLANRFGVRYRFEGAVMDGIPVFNLVRETMPAVRILGFRGVVNSTTNYIISALEDGAEFDAALAEMQRQGIAEADPSYDVDGWDAATKVAALVNVLMDGVVTPRDVARDGIRALTGERVREVVARGRRVRLVASASRAAGEVEARVRVEELAEGDPLAQLRGMSNALLLDTDLLGRVGIVQLDGGLTQTAYALLSDLIAIRRGVPSGRSEGETPAERPASG
jgi:homoserine dehydrogenase